jgi:uncharacterized protein (DUF2267 family)
VKQDEMVATVAQRAGASRRHADEIITATLTVLAERLTPDETKDLLAQLPKKYKANIDAVPMPELFSADDFVKRVSELEGERAPSFDEARVHVRAVLTTLREAVNAGEFRDVLDQLGPDYDPLLEDVPVPAGGAAESVADAVASVASATATAQREATETLTNAADVGRESANNLLETLAEVARLVQSRANDVATTAKDRALDFIVLAVDRLESVTERLDDAAEALQQRVHRRVEEERAGDFA